MTSERCTEKTFTTADVEALGVMDHVYVYHTGGHPDGLDYAIAIASRNPGKPKTVALFADKADAHAYANTLAAANGVDALILPSAE